MNDSEARSALESRWLPGHRAFEVLLAAMNAVLTTADRQRASEELEGLSNSLATLAILLRSATAAMHFAADFDSDTYRLHIRPTMSPPNMPPGFSGTLNLRHGEFLERFRALEIALKHRFGCQLESAPAELGTSWRDVLKMRSTNLAAHGLVCERFVPGGESLLQQHFYSENEKETP
jgi:hypothetical protein